MKRIIKFLTAILSVTMILSMFSGCTQNNEKYELATKEELDPAIIGDYSTLKLPIDDTFTEISVLHASDNTNLNDSFFINELRRRTGINVNVIAVPSSTIGEKAKILMSANEQMPDIMTELGVNLTNDFGNQGAFEEILQHIDELPNFKKIFYDEAEKYDTKDKIKNFLNGEGKLFMFPRYNISRKVNHGFLYRKDIFDKHGIKMWTTTEEFLDVLRQLKKLYPSSTPFVSKKGTDLFGDIAINYGLDTMTGFRPYYNEDEKVWKMSCTDPKFKDVLDLVKTMFDEGLIDPEFITATQPAWTAKMTQAEKAFVTWDWIGRLDMFKEQTLETVPSYDLRYAEPLEGKVLTLTNVLTGSSVKKGKNSMLALKLLDYLISDSGAILSTLGIEGVTFNYNEKGKADYIGFDEGKVIGITDLEAKYGLCGPVSVRYDDRCIYYNYTEKEQEAQDLMTSKEDGFWPEDPSLTFNEEENKVVEKYMTSLEKAAREFATKYVLNGNQSWEEWLKKAETLGAKEIVDAYNSAQNRYDKL